MLGEKCQIVVHLLIFCLLSTVAFARVDSQDKVYKETLQWAQKYDKAVDKGDLQQSLRAQEEALKLWNTLSDEQKLKLEKEKKGMYDWLQNGDSYDAMEIFAVVLCAGDDEDEKLIRTSYFGSFGQPALGRACRGPESPRFSPQDPPGKICSTLSNLFGEAGHPSVWKYHLTTLSSSGWRPQRDFSQLQKQSPHLPGLHQRGSPRRWLGLPSQCASRHCGQSTGHSRAKE